MKVMERYLERALEKVEILSEANINQLKDSLKKVEKETDRFINLLGDLGYDEMDLMDLGSDVNNLIDEFEHAMKDIKKKK